MENIYITSDSARCRLLIEHRGGFACSTQPVELPYILHGAEPHPQPPELTFGAHGCCRSEKLLHSSTDSFSKAQSPRSY